MSTILPFPAREQHHCCDDPTQSVDITVLVAQLQGAAADIATALETCVQATACFQRYEVASAHCARAAAHLHHLLQQVQALYRLVEPLSSLPTRRYPVLIQAHHVATLLEQAILAVQKARAQRGNLCRYLSAWGEAHQRIQTYPAQVTGLVATISSYCQAIVSRALQRERTCI
jgi:hypothetical protein